MSLNIVTGKYDIEAHQHETVELFISYVDSSDKVLDFSETFPGTTDPKYALMFSITPKRKESIHNWSTGPAPVPDNDILIDSINRFQLPEDFQLGLDGNWLNDLPNNYWVGKSFDFTPTVGQAIMELVSVNDPSDLREHTFKLLIENSVMREMEPGNYYYTIVLLEKTSAAIDWNNIFQDNASDMKSHILMGGMFRVFSAMNRDLEEGVGLNTVMSNSFGFGGTNASLVFTKS